MKEIFHRVNQYLFFFILLIVVMFFGKAFLVPIIFASLLAMLMAPVCRRFEKWGLNRAFATIGCILILLIVVGVVAFIVSTQISTFAENLSQIQAKAQEILWQAQSWIEEQIGMSPQQQEEVVKKEAEKSNQSGPSLPARILTGIISTVTSIVLTLVFTFLMIYNKEQFESFFLRLYADQDTEKVRTVVGQISHISQRYLTGRAMSVLIIACMYSVGLLIVGVKNALLLAGIAALLTVIPYLGTVLGGLFPVLMALLTQDIQTALMAAVVMITVQTIDNYFIEPNVVGGEVNLNALWSILSIIAGGMVWGVVGMILFLPLFGIVKIVCDHVEALKPVGYLMGEHGEKKSSRVKEWVMRRFGKGNEHKL